MQDEVIHQLKENVRKYSKTNAALEICKMIFEDRVQ